MNEHFCTACFQPSTAHTEGRCECGDRDCRWFPPLCCPGCMCGSYEEAHPTPAARQPNP